MVIYITLKISEAQLKPNTMKNNLDSDETIFRRSCVCSKNSFVTQFSVLMKSNEWPASLRVIVV